MVDTRGGGGGARLLKYQFCVHPSPVLCTTSGIGHLPCKIQPLDGKHKKGHQDSSLNTAPRVSTTCLPDGTARD